MGNKKLILLLMLTCVVLCMGAAVTHQPWDGTAWNTSAPNDEALVGNTYRELFDLRKGVGIRMDKEHIDLAGSSVGGEHVEGSARAWYEATGPAAATGQPDGTALVAGDYGMLWMDSDDNRLYGLTEHTAPVWSLIAPWTVATNDISYAAGLVTIGAATTGTTLQLETGTPILTLKNTTAEHTEAGAESQIYFEDHSNTLLARIKAQHDGTDDDTKGDLIFFTSGGDGTVEAIRIDSDQLVDVAAAMSVGTTLGVTGAATFTAESTFNNHINLGANDDLVGSATSDLNMDGFDVAGGTGNTDIDGTLTVAGATTLTGGGAFVADSTVLFNTTLTAASTFQNEDVGADVAGIGSASALIFVKIKCSAGDEFVMRMDGETGTYAVWTPQPNNMGGVNSGNSDLANGVYYLMCVTSSSGIIEIGGNSDSSTYTITMLGYIK